MTNQLNIFARPTEEYRDENDAWLGQHWGMSQRELDLKFPWGQDPENPVAEWVPGKGWVEIPEKTTPPTT